MKIYFISLLRPNFGSSSIRLQLIGQCGGSQRGLVMNLKFVDLSPDNHGSWKLSFSKNNQVITFVIALPGT